MSWFYDNIVERGQACTCWFDGWFGKDWSSCCKEHDSRYMTNKGRNMTKSKVDNDLFKCVRSKGGLAMASIMWIGNKAFSWYYWNKYKKDRE